MATLVLLKAERYINCILLFFVCTIFTACIGEENCDDMESSNYIENLIELTPQKTVYHQNDTLTLRLSLPSVNTYFGKELSIYEETNDRFELLVSNSALFTGNSLFFLKGGQGKYENWFDMPYNNQTGIYEIEVKITLKRLGEYSFYSSETIYFEGKEHCNRYALDTNIIWNYTNGKIEFTVNE